jgi:rhamnulokinase
MLHIVGGGSQNKLLNSFTATASGRPVLAGPIEATVFGNVLVQARTHGEIRSLADIRAVVRASSEMTQFEPADAAAWDQARDRFATLGQKKG